MNVDEGYRHIPTLKSTVSEKCFGNPLNYHIHHPQDDVLDITVSKEEKLFRILSYTPKLFLKSSS